MRILIATGIYPPEIGGPAFYAKNVADALRSKGVEVDIATFGTLKYLPTGIRHFALFLKMLPAMKRADHIIALDTFSAALPAYFGAKVFGKKMLVRTGGDFVWEQYIERTGDLLPLPDFYEEHKPLSLKERIYFALTKFLVARVTMIFSSSFQRDIWLKPYGLAIENTHVITNAIAESFVSKKPKKKNFLFYGRDLKLRNKKKLLQAFQNAKKQVPSIALEVGQVPQKELIEKIRAGYCVIMPSISDITPNYILDALRCGKPFILTKYSEYAQTYAQFGLTVDPLDSDDITAKIIQMCDKKTYADFVQQIAAAPLVRTYSDLADDFIAFVKARV
jgi:glycosyltransferase involved in cell wall biosynthesis